jgi:hypothetical protein
MSLLTLEEEPYTRMVITSPNKSFRWRIIKIRSSLTFTLIKHNLNDYLFGTFFEEKYQ